MSMTKITDYELMIECIRVDMTKIINQQRQHVTNTVGFITTHERELHEARVSGMEQVQRVVEGIIHDCMNPDPKPPPRTAESKRLKYYQRHLK